MGSDGSSDATRFASIVDALRDETDRRFALAELNDALTALVPSEFASAVDSIDVHGLDSLWQNYVAAMVGAPSERPSASRG